MDAITKILNTGNPEGKYHCVLGVADTERGREIRDRMITWLAPVYAVTEVWHDGSLFEQPALRYMQDWCKESGKSCLYLHTRGAYKTHWTTVPTRKMWKEEFGKHADEYFGAVAGEQAMVACPLTGSKNRTWYNGFVANAAAMCAIPAIEPNADRKVFEKLFTDMPVRVIGTRVWADDKKDWESLYFAREYLKRNYL